jgi:archaellum component FlaF (FlaF/FlaG flagellin family)
MGFSVAISGGIVCVTIIIVFSLVFAMTGQIYEINSSRTKSSDLDSALAHTDADIEFLYAPSEGDLISFTLANIGNEKLWNYEKFNVIVTYNASIAGVPTMTTERLTYNSAQAFAAAGASVQFARPDSDITNNNNWDDPAPGGDNDNILYDEIDEPTRNDADYTTSGPIDIILDNSETWEVGLSDVTDPQSSSGHIVKYVYRKDSSGNPQIDLTVTLLQGTTTIASWSHNNINQNFVLREQTLTAVQANSITDYTDLRLRFTAVHAGIGLGSHTVIISWAELVVPDDSGIYDCSASAITSGQWTIDSIYGDLRDPEILNTGEDGKICINLSNTIYPSTDLTMTITTDLGKTKSSARQYS